MALTPSAMLPLGTPAPAFTLLDTLSGKTVALEQLRGEQGTVVMFICNHCPYVQHILDKLVETAEEYQQKNIAFIAINSNDIVAYPADAPEKMAELARQRHFSFPYLFDATQDTARAYQAACTPDFYLFDKTLRCVYRGRFDQATPGKSIPVTGSELRAALDNLLSGQAISDAQYPSMGCNIKWKN